MRVEFRGWSLGTVIHTQCDSGAKTKGQTPPEDCHVSEISDWSWAMCVTPFWRRWRDRRCCFRDELATCWLRCCGERGRGRKSWPVSHPSAPAVVTWGHEGTWCTASPRDGPDCTVSDVRLRRSTLDYADNLREMGVCRVAPQRRSHDGLAGPMGRVDSISSPPIDVLLSPQPLPRALPSLHINPGVQKAKEKQRSQG